MSVGRPRKLSVVSTKHFSKEEKEARRKQEESLKVARNLVAPDWLCEEAKEEFYRIVEESTPLDIIDNMDISFLAMYSDAYANYYKIAEEINEMEILTESFDGEVKMNKTRYDLARMQEKYKSVIFQCSAKLGLATSDRLRLSIPVTDEKPANPFLQFIDEK